eukprot:1791034-Amphidinium_carterae.1
MAVVVVVVMVMMMVMVMVMVMVVMMMMMQFQRPESADHYDAPQHNNVISHWSRQNRLQGSPTALLFGSLAGCCTV